MITIGTLGPEGTFSDIATRKYISDNPGEYEIIFYKSIKMTLDEIGKGCRFAILPIENYSEGFVSLVLDSIVDSELFITAEILLPIHFSFVSNAANMAAVRKLFVQFVAKNQCSEFLERLEDVQIVTTESNIASLDSVKAEHSACSGAIVPVNSFAKEDFQFSYDDVNDYCNNQTRFLMFSTEPSTSIRQEGIQYKTSIVVFNDHDRPGLLESILSPFSKRDINLTSITSRPTKRQFGTYNFFIGLEGHAEETQVREALEEVKKYNRLRIFGSYPMASLSS